MGAFDDLIDQYGSGQPAVRQPADPAAINTGAFDDLIGQYGRHDPEGPIGAAGNALIRGGIRLQSMLPQFGVEQAMQREADKGRTFGGIVGDQTGRGILPGPLDMILSGGRYIASRLSGDDRAAADAHLAEVNRLGTEAGRYPMSPGATDVLKRATEASAGQPGESLIGRTLNALGVLAGSPGSTAGLAAQIGLESLPQMAVGAGAGLLTGSPAAGAAAMGLTSGLSERYTSPADFFASKGLDIGKPEDRAKILSDTGLMSEAEHFGFRRGSIIGAFDAMSGGVAGKELVSKPLANMAAQAGAQAAMGAAGEAGAQLATTGTVNPIDVILEALGEFAGSPGEVAAMAPGKVKAAVQSALSRFASKRGDAGVTPQAVAEAVTQGDPEAVAILRSAGMTDDQIRALSPGAAEAFATRVQDIRAQRSERPPVADPVQQAGEHGLSQADYARRLQVDLERAQAERDGVAAGEIDPAATSATGRQPVGTIQVNSHGQAYEADPGVDEALRRNRGRPTTETALVPLEPQARPMTDEQIAQARRDMETPPAQPAGPDMVQAPGQAPRETASVDRAIGAIRDRIGADPVALVRDMLGVSEQDFRRMSPDGMERLVASAQRQQSARQPGPTMATTDAALSGQEGWTPEGDPGRYSPSSAPQRGAGEAGRGQQPTEAELAARNPDYSRTSGGLGDRPYRPDSTDSATADQMAGFQRRAETLAEMMRRFEEAQRAEQKARGARPGEPPHPDTTKPGSAKAAPLDRDGRYPTTEATDRNGNPYVRSDRGGPVVFADQKQAGRWALSAQKNSPDQVFEIANHPTQAGRFTVVERGRSEPKASPEAGVSQAAPGQPSAEPASAQGDVKALPAPADQEQNGAAGDTRRPLAGTPTEPQADAAPPAAPDNPAPVAPPAAPDNPAPVAPPAAKRQRKAKSKAPPAADQPTGQQPAQEAPKSLAPNYPAGPPGSGKGSKIGTPRSGADLESRLNRQQADEGAPTLNKEQAALADDARTRSLASFDAAIEQARGNTDHQQALAEWRAKAERQAVLQGAIQKRDGFLAGALGQPEARSNKEYVSHYRMGEGWRAKNPPPESSTKVTATIETASGQKTVFKMDPIPEQIEAVKERVSKLPRSTFYSFPANLFDPQTWKGVADFFRGLIDRDAVETLAETPRGDKLKGNPVAWVGRKLQYSNDGVLRVLADIYKSPTITKVANLFFAQAGHDAGTGQTFDEAISSRTNSRHNALGRILDGFSKTEMRQLANLVRNPGAIRAGTRIGDAAAKIQNWLKEEHAYLKAAGVDVGKVDRGYLPRMVDYHLVHANPSGFRAAATKAYVAAGLSGPEAAKAAESWVKSILLGDMGGERDFHSVEVGGTPDADFAKGRALPKQADAILKDFLIDDLGDMLSAYLTRVTRRAEWARRMGDDLSKWKELKAAMQAEGVTDAAMTEVVGAIQVAAGLMPGQSSRFWRSGMSWARVWTTLGSMERATLTSLSDVAMPMIRSGRFLDFPRTVGLAAKALTGNVKDLRAFAEDMGLISAGMSDGLLAARYAGLDITSKKQALILNKYFERTGLEGWTRGMRVASLGIARTFIRRMALQTLDGGELGAMSLRELGVPEGKEKDFARWLAGTSGGMPTVADLNSGPHAEAYRTALVRFVDQSILRPTRNTRPQWASTPFGSVIFQLSSFNYDFQKNVLNRLGQRTVQGFTRPGLSLGERAQLVGSVGLLVPLIGLAFAIGELRDALLGDPAKLAKETDVDKAVKTLSRASVFGEMDRLVNLFVMNARYPVDPGTFFAGPFGGMIFSSMRDFLGEASPRNSEHTNTAERKAINAMWNIGIEPAINLALTAIGGGLAGKLGSAVVTQAAGAYPVRETFMPPDTKKSNW